MSNFRLKAAALVAAFAVGVFAYSQIGTHNQAQTHPPNQVNQALAQPANQAALPAPAMGAAPIVINNDHGNTFQEAMAGAMVGNILSGAGQRTVHHTTVVQAQAFRATPSTARLVQAKPATLSTTPAVAPKPLAATVPIASTEEKVIQRRLVAQDGVTRQVARQATSDLRTSALLPALRPAKATNSFGSTPSRTFTMSSPTRSSGGWSSFFGGGRSSSSSRSSWSGFRLSGRRR